MFEDFAHGKFFIAKSAHFALNFSELLNFLAQFVLGTLINALNELLKIIAK